jgi:hypothetical protein
MKRVTVCWLEPGPTKNPHPSMRVLVAWRCLSSQCAGPHPAHAIVPNRIVAIVRIVHVGVEDEVHGSERNPAINGVQRFHWQRETLMAQPG